MSEDTIDPIETAPTAGAAAAAGRAPPELDLAALRARVLDTLRRRHELDAQRGLTLLGAGLGLLLVAGFLIAFALTFANLLLTGGQGLSFRAWFGLYLLAAIALCAWEASRSRGGFFTFASGDVDLRRDPENTSEYLINRTRTHLQTAAEVAMWGPRALVAGARALLGVKSSGLDLVLPEAADTLTLLLSLGGGVKFKDLAPPDTDPMQLMPVLKWLDTHDYVGFSSRGDRVWVSSVAKKLFG